MNPISTTTLSKTIIESRSARRARLIAKLREIERRRREDKFEIERKRTRLTLLVAAGCFIAGAIALLF